MENFRFLLSVSKLVGAASDRSWSQIHTFIPSDKKILRRGALLAAIHLKALDSTEEGVLDLPSFGKEIIQRLHEHYFGASEDSVSPLELLTKSVEAVSSEFSQVAVEVVAGVILPVELSAHLGVLYLAIRGQGSVVLMRGGRLYRILLGSSDQPQHVITASGFVQDGDLLVFGSSDFFRLLPHSALQNALRSLDPVEASSILAPLVHGGEENSGVAAVLCLVQKAPLSATPLQTAEEPQEDLEGQPEPIQKGREGGRRLSRLRVFLDLSRRFPNWLRRGAADSILGLHLPHEDIVVKAEAGKRRSLMFSIAIVVLLLLGVSVVFGWRRRVALEQEKAFAAVWEVADHQYQEALGLVDLNPLRSRALLMQAEHDLSDALSSPKPFSKSQRERLTTLLSELSSVLERVSGEYRTGEAPVFMDLALVRPNTFGESLALHGDSLVVLDRTSGVLIRIGISNKSAEPVGGGSLLSQALLTGVYSGRGFVLARAGVVEVSLSGKTSAVVIQSDPEWGDIIDLSVFGGNLYLLDRGTSEIFRYPGTEGGFGPRTRWLGESVLPDLADSSSFAIDGDIWILKPQTILRFTRGVLNPFSITGMDVGFSQPSILYTTDESERLYVLDRGNQRVVVLDKNGEYRSQYIWDGLQGVSDMVVTETEGKILLLSGSMIYEIPLRK